MIGIVRPLIDSGPLKALLNRPKPVHLYHYTGPDGVIGILKSRTLWAGRPADMNDSTEQKLAREHAVKILSNRRFPKRSFGEGMVQYALENLPDHRGFRFERFDTFESSRSRAYTVSLTSEMDALEQWRAYCPRSGGVAMGFSTNHLMDVAADQGFILVPCVYDRPMQEAVIEQIVTHHLGVWNERRPLEAPRQGISSHLVHDFIADLERFAPLLKHPSFRAEREWRLVSPLVGEWTTLEYVHVPGPSGIKQFRPFSLLTAQHPLIKSLSSDGGWWPSIAGFRPVIGPNIDPGAMDEVLRTLTPHEFGRVYHAERTASPYR